MEAAVRAQQQNRGTGFGMHVTPSADNELGAVPALLTSVYSSSHFPQPTEPASSPYRRHPPLPLLRAQLLLPRCFSTVARSRTMAKLLFCVAVLLVVSAVLAEAHTVSPTRAPAPAPGNGRARGDMKPVSVAAPALAPTVATAAAPAPAIHKKSGSFSLKCIIHNVATRNVTFKLAIQGKVAGSPVVAKAGQWTAIGPVKVGCKVPVVQVYVTVKTNKGLTVTKTFPVQLEAFLKNVLAKSSKVLVLTAAEVKSWKGDLRLVIKVGRKVMLIVKL